MATTTLQPRVTSFAPQFLVDDLTRSIEYYEKLGFIFSEPWAGFYAIGQLDGLELHLKEAPKNQDKRYHRGDHEYLDAAAGIEIRAYFQGSCGKEGRNGRGCVVPSCAGANPRRCCVC